MTKNSLFLIALIFASCSQKNISSQKPSPDAKQEATETTPLEKQDIPIEDRVYQKNIKTVQLYESTFELSSPIISLAGGQQLKLSFDDLNGGLKYYNYTIVHCNADWTPSPINQFEYLHGYLENNINDYRFSFNTLQKYTHYNLFFPNENLKLTKSGNYILKVYSDNDPNKLAFTKRFMVFEEKVTINCAVRQPAIIDDRNYKQEVDFSILHPEYDIPDPYSALKVVIYQNDRKDNLISDLKPLFVKNDELVYDYDRENVFNGGNEFRNFDIKSLRYQSEFIKSVSHDSSGNHVYLVTSEKRSFRRFYLDRDINGKYLIKVQEGRNSEIEADYAMVHFFLSMDNPISDGDLYILGQLTEWSFKPEFKMRYNYKRFGYEADLYLKQGYYNYEYVVLANGQKTADETLIEGTHFETENDYTILVYHRERGDNYDRLIGVKRINSIRNN